MTLHRRSLNSWPFWFLDSRRMRAQTSSPKGALGAALCRRWPASGRARWRRGVRGPDVARALGTVPGAAAGTAPRGRAAAGATEQEKEATAAAPPGKDSAETVSWKQRSRNALVQFHACRLRGTGAGPRTLLPSASPPAPSSRPPLGSP